MFGDGFPRPGGRARFTPANVIPPFACVEAAANLLTNSAIDPSGKIPEFKYSAARVDPEHLAAE